MTRKSGRTNMAFVFDNEDLPCRVYFKEWPQDIDKRKLKQAAFVENVILTRHRRHALALYVTDVQTLSGVGTDAAAPAPSAPATALPAATHGGIGVQAVFPCVIVVSNTAPTMSDEEVDATLRSAVAHIATNNRTYCRSELNDLLHKLVFRPISLDMIMRCTQLVERQAGRREAFQIAHDFLQQFVPGGDALADLRYMCEPTVAPSPPPESDIGCSDGDADSSDDEAAAGAGPAASTAALSDDSDSSGSNDDDDDDDDDDGGHNGGDDGEHDGGDGEEDDGCGSDESDSGGDDESNASDDTHLDAEDEY